MRPITRYLGILLACLAFAVPTGFASGALAQSATSMCNGDDALVGVANAIYVVTNLGSPLAPQPTPVYINFAIASCAPLDDGELGEAYTADTAIQFPSIPVTQPSGTAAKTCGSGRVVTTLQGVTAGGMVNDFRFGCSEPGDGNVRFTKGPSNADFEDQCGNGQYAHGITASPTGQIGFAEFGIKCLKMKQASHRDDGEDDEKADDDHGGKGGDDGFLFGKLHFQIDVNGATIKFGNKGKVRVVDEPTTIYKSKGEDELDYLDEGDKVVVVACEDKGKGWCAIVKPEVGYIWGADLK
jgi:hypothetical protein